MSTLLYLYYLHTTYACVHLAFARMLYFTIIIRSVNKYDRYVCSVSYNDNDNE